MPNFCRWRCIACNAGKPRPGPPRRRFGGDRGLRQGDPRSRRPRGGAGRDDGARRPARRLAGDGHGDGQEDGRPRARHLRALPRRRADRDRGAHGPRGDPPPPPARVVPRRGARDAVGPRPRRGRGARALHQRGPRGADRRRPRRSRPRSARRSDPRPRPDPHRPGARGSADRARGGGQRACSRGSPTATRRCSGSSTATRSGPGVALEVLRREPFGGAVVVACEAGECALGPDLAARMLVVPEERG